MRKFLIFFGLGIVFLGFLRCSEHNEISAFEKFLLSKEEVTITEGENSEVKIVSGSGVYTLQVNNKNILNSEIKRRVVYIEAKATGEASVDVRDEKSGKVISISVKINPSIAIQKDKVTIKKGEWEVVKINKGTGKYELTSSDKTIVVGKVEEQQLKLKAVGYGKAQVTVKDIITGLSKTIDVTTLGTSILKDEVLLKVNESKEIEILGSGHYDAVSENSNVAKVFALSDKIKVVGTGKGNTLITVLDKVTKEKLPISVKVNELITVDKTNVNLVTEETAYISIISGSGDYTFSTDNEDFVDVKLVGNELKIKGKVVGKVVVTITDKITHETVDINVNIVDRVVLDKSKLTLLKGDSEEVLVKGGSRNYTSEVDNEDRLMALISGNKLRVTAKDVGGAKVTVNDTVTQTKVELEVFIYDAIRLSKEEVSITSGEDDEIFVENGSGKYTAISNETEVVTVQIIDTKIKLTGINKGSAIVKVTDNITKVERVIKVKVNDEIKLEKSKLSLLNTFTENINFLSGSGNYTVAISNGAIVDASIFEGKLKITGRKKGKTKITVKDTETNKTTFVDVIVNELLKLSADEISTATTENELKMLEGAIVNVAIVGNDSYQVDNGDSFVAEGSIIGNILKISAKAEGTTKITVKDKVTGRTEYINVSVEAEQINELVVDPKLSRLDKILEVGEELLIEIQSGNPPYTVTVSEPNILDVSIAEKKDKSYIKVIPVKYIDYSVLITLKDRKDKTVGIDASFKNLINIQRDPDTDEPYLLNITCGAIDKTNELNQVIVDQVVSTRPSDFNTTDKFLFPDKCKADVKKITFKLQLNYLTNYVFDDLESLQEVEIPIIGNINTKGETGYAFQNCSNLKKVIMSDATEEAKDENYGIQIQQAFNNCPILEEVTLPVISSVGAKTFNNCPNLKKIILTDGLDTTYASIDENAFGNLDLSKITLVVPSEYLSDFQNSSWGGYFSNIVESE